jgi:hypothetical protein
MKALGTADHLAFAEELHFIRQFNRMKMLMTVHLSWTLFPYACIAEVVFVQTWKNVMSRNKEARGMVEVVIGLIFQWLERHDVLVRDCGKVTEERKLLI